MVSMVGSGASALHAASVRAQHRTLIEGFIALRPKKRTNKVSWVIFGGCAYFVVALIGDASVREALFAPRGEARAPQYAATAPAAQRAPVQVQHAQPQLAQATPGQTQATPPAVVTFPVFAVPAGPAAGATDAPLPHPKAHHTAPTHRAHSRSTKRTK